MKKLVVLAVLILALSASVAMAAPLASWTTYLTSPLDQYGADHTHLYYAVTLDASIDWNTTVNQYEYTYVLTNKAGLAPTSPINYRNDYYKPIHRFTMNTDTIVTPTISIGVTPGKWFGNVDTGSNLVSWTYDSNLAGIGGPIMPGGNATFSYFSKYGPSSVQGAFAIDGMTFSGATLAPTPVPEASTLVGFGSALAMAGPGLVGWLRRRRA